jgi:hypothetical protein
VGKFWRALDGKMFNGHLGYFMTIWYILCSFGTFLRFWYVWIKKNLATLIDQPTESRGLNSSSFWADLNLMLVESFVVKKLTKSVILTSKSCGTDHSCQMYYFSNQNANMGKFWRV